MLHQISVPIRYLFDEVGDAPPADYTYSVIGPIENLQAAVLLAATEQIDVAVVDIDIAGRLCRLPGQDGPADCSFLSRTASGEFCLYTPSALENSNSNIAGGRPLDKSF